MSQVDSADCRREQGFSFEERKRYSCFTAEDARLVAGLRSAVERRIDRMVDRFYEHLGNFDTLRPLLANEEVVARLRGFQREYLLSLTSGTYGADYVESRLRIGRVHEAVGIEPQWYLGAYGLYLELLNPCVHDAYAADPARLSRAHAALSKLLLLDMQLALDIYYEKRQQKALRRSRRLAAMGELAASVAHEVRNPLAGMKGALEVLRDELSVKPSNREIVDELLAQIHRLENLVRDLLNFARPLEPTVTPFELHDLLDRVVRLYQADADAAQITIHRAYGPGTAQLVADPQQIEQVALNLIHNAIQAVERDGTVTLSTRADDGTIEIVFADSGAGIAPEDLSRIFQPFFTTKHRGSGLGLPIVKRIVEAHDGTVTVESGSGEGTRVRVRIPLTEAD